MSVERIHAAFASVACAPDDEAALSAIVNRVLTGSGLEFRCEVKLDGNAWNRIDFIVGRVGLELKTKGGPAEALRNPDRDVLEKLDKTGQRVRSLAEQYLKKKTRAA